jgi:hypothetical protein
VKDANGSVVVGAQAKFVSRKTGEAKTLVTDWPGVVLELEPATYEVIVTAFGFRPLKSQIALNAGEETKIDLVLEVVGLGCPSKDCIVDPVEPMVEQEHVETKSIDVKSVQLLTRQSNVNKEKPTAFKEFRESRNGRVNPATKFDVVCEIRGELDLPLRTFSSGPQLISCRAGDSGTLSVVTSKQTTSTRHRASTRNHARALSVTSPAEVDSQHTTVALRESLKRKLTASSGCSLSSRLLGCGSLVLHFEFHLNDFPYLVT